METPEEHSHIEGTGVTASPNRPLTPPVLCSFVLKIKENSLFCLFFFCFDFKKLNVNVQYFTPGTNSFASGFRLLLLKMSSEQ